MNKPEITDMAKIKPKPGSKWYQKVTGRFKSEIDNDTPRDPKSKNIADVFEGIYVGYKSDQKKKVINERVPTEKINQANLFW